EALLAAQREKELREQEQAARREQELLAQKQAAQEKKEPPQNSEFRQLIGEIIEDLIGRAMNTMLLSINLKSQRLDMEKKEVKNIIKQATKHKTRITESLQNFTIIHKMSSISNTPQISSVIANTPDLPTKEPEYSQSMGDEHLNTIPETKSDEVIKSSVKNLFPIPSESEVTYDNKKSLLNRDILTISYPKIDSFLEEFFGELAHIDPIPQGIEEADFDLEEEIRNIHFLEELLSNDPLPLPKNDSSNYDHHHDPSFPRPLPEPLDIEVFFDFEPDTGVLTTKVVKGISEHYVLMPNILPTLPTLDPDLPSHLLMIPSDPKTRFSIWGYSLKSNPKYFYHGRNFLSHSSDKITSDFSENPMMMYGGDIPLLDVPYLYFYPLDQAQVQGIESGSRLD
nr:hypothetical protein [Tanacetum cinerariifolium]